MIIKCLNDCKVIVGNVEYAMEEIDGSPNIYDVPDDVGKAAVATRNCEEIVVDDEHPYKGPAPELPIIHRLPQPEPVKAPAPAPAAKAKKKTEPD